MTRPDGTTCSGWNAAVARDVWGCVRRRTGGARAASVRRRADGFARVAASTAVSVALAFAFGAQAASLSLSDVKIKARTSADEWEYVTLSNGLDRTKKTDIKWLIHLPNYHWTTAVAGSHWKPDDTGDDIDITIAPASGKATWPDAQRPSKAQVYMANELYGGLFDYAGTARWWPGMKEWVLGVQGRNKSSYGNMVQYGFMERTPLGKYDAYYQARAWWRGETTQYPGNSGIRSKARTSSGGTGGDYGQEFFDSAQYNKWMLTKTLYAFFQHIAVSFWPEKLDLVAAEAGENTYTATAHMAFSRGAARQYGKVWGMDFSDWWGGFLSDYGGWWQTAAEDADACWEVDTNDGVVAWRTGDNASYWKKPGTADAVSLLSSGVLELKVGNDSGKRFAVRTVGRVKVASHTSGDLSTCCTWSNIWGDGSSSGVKELLALNGGRVAMLLTDDSVLVRGVHNNGSFAGSYQKGWLSGNHIVLLKTDGTLGQNTTGYISSGSYSIATIDTGVADAAVAGSSVLYLKTDGRLYYKANLTTGSAVEVRSSVVAETAAGVKDFALVRHGGATRIGVLYNNGVLRVGAAPASIAASSSKLLEHVDRFRMAGNRIAAIQQGDDGMQVLKVRDGLDGTVGWVPMMFVRMADFGLSSGSDDDALFVQTVHDQKILLKNNGLEEFEYTGTDSTDERNYQANYRLWSFADTTQWTGNTNWASQLWGGHSENLEQRIAYATYMGGANVLYWEGGGMRLFLGRKNSLSTDANGVETGAPTLSREGVMAMHYYDFTKRTLPHEERGIAWAPVAIMLDAYHGMQYSASAAIWMGAVGLRDPDYMNFSVLNAIWPGAVYRSWTTTNEYRFQINGPYGEIFDVLTEWAPADVIANYPVVIMSGSIRPGTTLRNRLKNYVNGGGNLVINSAMNVADFGASFTGATLGTAASRSVPGLRWKIDDTTTAFSPARSISAQPMTLSNGASALLATTDSTPVTLASIRTHGQGRVIVVALPNLQDGQFWGFLLRKLSENPAVNPFKVDGDIMYQVNYKGANAWMVTLINNRGVNKTSSNNNMTRQSFSASGARTVSLRLQEAGRAVSSVTEYPIFHGIWTTGRGAVGHAGDRFTVIVGPGETRVFEVATEAASG